MKSNKGQSLVEFALVLPVLILILLGIVDFGRVLHVYLTIDHAGREAARAASVGKDDATVKSVAVNDATSINLTVPQVTVNPPGTKSSGSNVVITINYQFNFMTPVVGGIISPITVTNSTTMRVE